MTITLINCTPKLSIKSIAMNDIGAFDKLCGELNSLLPFSGLEYDFPTDTIKITFEEGQAIPDLSAFGEVQPYDTGQ